MPEKRRRKMYRYINSLSHREGLEIVHDRRNGTVRVMGWYDSAVALYLDNGPMTVKEFCEKLGIFPDDLQ